MRVVALFYICCDQNFVIRMKSNCLIGKKLSIVALTSAVKDEVRL